MNRRSLTEAEREQRGQQMRAAWAAGKFAHRKKGMHPRHWVPAQNQALAELAGTMPIDDIADAFEQRFYIRRTTASLRIQAKRLGISLWQGGLSLQEMTRLFGVDHRIIKRFWVEPGHISGRRWKARGPNDGWWFDQAEVERFVRESGWLYDWTRMPKGHRLTRLAETVHRADPWVVGLAGLCPLLSLAPCNIKKWMQRGLIPHRRRPGAGGLGEIVVRGRDIAVIRAAIAEAQQTARQQSQSSLQAIRQVESQRAYQTTLRHQDRIVGACKRGHVRTLVNTRVNAARKLACLDCRADRIAMGRAG